MPMVVPRDSGEDFIDQNGHRMKKLTLLPLIKAVQDLTDQGATPKFDWPSVDFVTDRSHLQKLLAWTRSGSDKWRIDTELAGTKTVLLSSNGPVTKTTGGRSTSYGFKFEEASTYPVPGLENEPSHHRIIAYVSKLYSVPHTLVLSASRTSMAFEWLFVSGSGPASLMIPALWYPPPTIPQPVGTARRKQRPRVHPLTLQM